MNRIFIKAALTSAPPTLESGRQNRVYVASQHLDPESARRSQQDSPCPASKALNADSYRNVLLRFFPRPVHFVPATAIKSVRGEIEYNSAI